MSPVTRSNKAAKEAATLLEDAAQRVGHLLKTLNTYFDAAKLVMDNGAWFTHPTIIVSPVDFLAGWVENMSQAEDELRGRFLDQSSLDNDQLQITMQRLFHDYYRLFSRRRGLVGAIVSLVEAAVELEEKTRKALEEGGMRKLFYLHPNQEADQESAQETDRLVLAAQTAAKSVRKMAKTIADDIDGKWMPKVLPID